VLIIRNFSRTPILEFEIDFALAVQPEAFHDQVRQGCLHGGGPWFLCLRAGHQRLIRHDRSQNKGANEKQDYG